MAKDWIAYDVKARKKVKMVEPKLVTLKNGKFALKGTSEESGIVLFRIIGSEDAEKFKAEQ